MGDLAIWLGAMAAVALACLATGWHVGRRHEKRRCKQRVALALSQLEKRHKRELNHWQAVLAEQALQLKAARIKARTQDLHTQQSARSHHP